MLIPLADIHDPRLADFREIKEKSLERRGLFIAEGGNVVLRLLRSSIRCAAVVLADNRAAEYAPEVPAETPTYILSASSISQLLGFKFHAGVVALGQIPPSPDLASAIPTTGPARVVVLPEISASDNLGTLIRLSAGLGADAILIGERCSDPWMRRTVRVSMGTLFSIPLIRCTNILEDLHHLRTRHALTTIATVLDPTAEPLGQNPPPSRLAILFGSEGQGLRPEESAACSRRLTIPMSRNIDSLNVGTAAGIILWHLFQAPH